MLTKLLTQAFGQTPMVSTRYSAAMRSMTCSQMGDSVARWNSTKRRHQCVPQ